MNLFKKATATLALVALLSGIFTTGVSAASTAEIEAANYLAKAGIIVDHTDNPTAYNLDQNVLRQEIAAVARGIAGLDKKDTCDNIFKDVSATKPNNWACYTVEQLADNGLIALNENFRPEDNISKAEAIGMVVKAAFGDEYMYDPTLTSTWQEQVVAFAVKNGVTSNFTNYDTPATRGFVFAGWANAMEVINGGDSSGDIKDIMCELLGICEDDTDPKDPTDPTDPTNPVTTKGNVEITLNPKSPVSQTIPSSGLVPFGKFDLSAGSEDVTVESIILKREGLSQRTDIKRVYFERNGIRISNRSSISMDEVATVTFTPALSIKAGSTETLDLIVELKDPDTGNKQGATVGAEHRFSIASTSDITASSTVGGTFPLRTALMRVGSYVVENVTIKPVTNDTRYTVGQENALMGEFQLDTGNGEKDTIFKSITLRNAGSGDPSSSLANIGIYRDGKKVSSEVSISGRDVTIYVNDEIAYGRTENYEIRADIIGAEQSTDTYQFMVRKNATSDLTVVEKESGFSAPITVDDDVSSLTDKREDKNSSRFSYIDVEGGDFLVSRDTSFTSTQTVSSATNDVVLWAVKTNVQEEVSIEDVIVDYSKISGFLLKDFSALKLLVGGSTVATYTPGDSDDAKSQFTFDSNFNVKAGQSTMKVIWNLKSGITDGKGFQITKVKLDDSAYYVSNDEKITINGNITGITTTVKEGAMYLTRNDGIDNPTLVPGTLDKLVFGFSVRATDVSDIKLTGLSFNAVEKDKKSITDSNLTSYVSNFRLYQDGKLVPNGTKNTLDFNSLDITIAKNASSNFQLVADFSNSINPDDANTPIDNFQLILKKENVKARNLSSNNLINPSANESSFPFTFRKDGGTLTAKTNSSQPTASIITQTTGSTETSVFKFDLEAKDDSIMVTDVYVTNTATTTVKLSDALKSSSLYINGKSYGGTVVGDDKIHFAIGSSNVIVKADQVMTWDVRVAFHDSSSALRSNKALQFSLKEVLGADGKAAALTDETTDTKNGIRAISESTGTAITRAGGTVSSNEHLLARSKPTVAAASFTHTSTDMYRFTITADSNRRITLDKIGLKDSGSADLHGSTITIYRDSQTAGNEVFIKHVQTWGSTAPKIATGTVVQDATTGSIYTTTVSLSDDLGTAYSVTLDGATYNYTLTAADTSLEAAAIGLAKVLNNVTNVTAAPNGTTKTQIDIKIENASETVTPVINAKAFATNDWVLGKASREISAGSMVTFYVTIDNAKWPLKDQRRETQITALSYFDELDGGPTAPIEADLYNVGLPTTADSYTY